jgi:hypothetical protein
VQQTITTSTGGFTVSRNFDNGVTIQFFGNQLGNFWTLDFAAVGNAQLEVGLYEGATRFPFQAANEPGLSVSGDGRGCNTLTGRFEVIEVTYGLTGEVESFAADFEQHCEGLPPALIGSIRFNSDTAVASRCLSRVTSISALRAEVALLAATPSSRRLLTGTLQLAQDAIEKKAPRRARRWLGVFIWDAIELSALRTNDSRRITQKASDGLVCSAANVLGNISIP